MSAVTTEMDRDARDGHLRLLRALGRRLSAGSLLLRGWVVLLVAALLAVAANPLHARFGWLAVVIAIAFWGLDAHLLRQRRLYQKVYRRARVTSEARVDLSLDTSAVQSEREAWGSLMFSPALAAFYGGLIGSIALVRLIWP